MAVLKHILVRIFFRLFAALFSVLPRGCAARLGGRLGDLTRIMLPKQANRAREHLQKAFPEWSREKTDLCLKQNFRHYGITLSELFRLEKLMPRVEIDGMEHLEGGAVLVSGHCGNWELMARTIGRRGPGLIVVAREAYLNTLNTFLVRLRRKGGVQTILRGSSDSPRQLLQAVKDRSVLGMLIDQDTKVDGVFVDFFGHPAHTPVGAAKLAVKYEIPVVTGFIHRTPSGGHRLRFAPPLNPMEYNETALTQLLTRRIEDQIRAHPAQWVWVHRRWKKRPPREDGNP